MRHIFREINQIIERDSKDTTYKFALLRGTIEVIQSKSPFITVVGDRVRIPIGLLVERWLLYYYPFMDAGSFIPQKNGEKNKPGVRLAFRPPFEELTTFYQTRGRFSAFYQDLVHRGIPDGVRDIFLRLCRKLANTLVRMPMKYIGRSVSDDFYSIFTPYTKKYKSPTGRIDVHSMIDLYGSFTIPVEYYEVFMFMGSYISGMEGILAQWADFTVNASKAHLTREQALALLLRSPIQERDIKPTGSFYREMIQKEGTIPCVWTGRAMRKGYEIDHVFPFSVWKNNNLWNLLPASRQANNTKRDKIPSKDLLLRQKPLINDYWGKLARAYPDRFHRELQIALLGEPPAPSDWKDRGFQRLLENAHYLIEERGYEPWNGLT